MEFIIEATEDRLAPTRGGGAEVRSLARAIDLLDLFDDLHPTRSLTEFVEGTGLPKTTVLRLVGSLSQRHLLSQRAPGQYTLGARLLRWVRLAHATWDIPAAARARMRRLSDDTGETVNLYVRQGLSRVVIAQEESRASVRNVVEVGVELPLIVGAAGKILLAAELHLIDATDLHVDEDTRARLRTAVVAVAEQGYAASHGERELGSSGVAVPIRAPSGAVMASLALGGPTPRFTADRVASHVTALRKAAEDIAQIGLPGLTPRPSDRRG